MKWRFVILKFVLFSSLYGAAEPVTEIPVDACLRQNYQRTMESLNLVRYEGKSVKAIYKQCGWLGTNAFRSEVSVSQVGLSLKYFNGFLDQFLLDKKNEVVSQFDRYNENEIAVWIITFQKQSFVRYITLPQKEPLQLDQEYPMGVFLALTEIIKQAQTELKITKQPDKIMFLRRDKTRATLLNAADLDLFYKVDREYLRPKIAFVSIKNMSTPAVFTFNNFGFRNDPVYIERPLAERLDRVNRAVYAAREYVSTVKQRLAENPKLREAYSTLGRLDILQEALKRLERRMPFLVFQVSGTEEDFESCHNGLLGATLITYIVDREKQYKIFRHRPVGNWVWICDLVFRMDFDSREDLSVTVLHESLHQTGVGSEYDATFLSNMIYILANAKTVKTPGYSQQYNFSPQFQQLIKSVSELYPQ